MDTDVCAGKRGLMKCRGELLPYEDVPGEAKQAFCTKCSVEWNISVFGDGCVKFEKRAPFRSSNPETYHPVATTTDGIRKGDHVIWGRGSDRRHGIVGKILNQREVRVFSLSNEGKGKIEKVKIDLTKSAIVVVGYSDALKNKVHNPTDQVILRARSHARRRGAFASSEQFAVFCKTGFVKRFEMSQFKRELYDEAMALFSTIDKLELASNVSILVFNILLAIVIESWVECSNCGSRESEACVSRRYWFLSEILLIAFEGLVFLFYVVYELYVNPGDRMFVPSTDEVVEVPSNRLTTYRGVPRYLCEYVGGVFFAIFMVFCSARCSLCVAWCKVPVGIILGVIGKILGCSIGHVWYRRLESSEKDTSRETEMEDPIT